MMEFKEIQDLLKLVNKTDLTEVEIEQENFKIKIRRKAPESNVIYTTHSTQQPAVIPAATPSVAPAPETVKERAVVEKAAVAPAKEEDVSGLIEHKSPMIGTFYRSSTPEADAFVKVGDTVEAGQVLCIIEAMKLFNEIESEVSGKVVKIMVENAQPVEYDQVLFMIDPS